jgi:predicted permease
MEAEMNDELQFHLDRAIEKNLRAGMGRDEARRQAMIAFGGVERYKEKTRAEWGVRPLEDLARDLRLAIRTLRKSPGVVVVTVISLGLGIAASATVFSAGSSLAFPDPGPLGDPETIVAVYTSDDDGRPFDETSFPDYLDIRSASQTLEALAAHRVGVVTVGDPEARNRMIVELVTANYFQVLGVTPVLGRGFIPGEAPLGQAERSFVLSHRAWRERFGADRGVLGQTLELDGQPFTIIGVAPEGLLGRYLQMDVDGWAPLDVPGGIYRVSPEALEDRSSRQFFLLGRMALGRSLEEVESELSILAARLHQEHGELWEDARDQPLSLTAVGEADSRVPPDARIPLMGTAGFFLTGALLILLLACSNVASLLLARAHRRSRELAIRTSLGAGRSRLLRMLLSESLLLALLGGGLGLYLTLLATRRIGAIPLPVDVPLRFDFGVDGRVLFFILVVSLGASLVAGIGPALTGSRPNLSPALKSDPGLGRGKGRRITFRGLLVVCQVMAATMLVIGAGLALRSVQASTTYDIGLDADGVAIMWKEPPREELGPEERRSYFLDLAERLHARPEVESVALARIAEAHVFMEDFATALIDREDDEPLRVRFNAVTSEYLDMMGIPLVRGRGIELSDAEGAPVVAVVNETFLERLFPEGGGVGDRFRVTAWFDADQRQERAETSVEIVGVVASPVRPGGGRAGPFFWTSYLQDPPVRAIIHAVGQGPPTTLVSVLRREIPYDPREFTLIDPSPYQDLIDYRFLGHRITGQVLSFAGLFALALAFIGVFGIVSFAVSQRFREMAIRQAMGAERAEVVRAVVAGGLRTTGVGVALGLALVVPLAFLARSALLGVGPLDPAAVGGGVLVLLLAALLAGLIPSTRLARAEPMEVLRDE